MDPNPNSMKDDPISESLITYNELNSSVVEELNEIPSALEFMRYVARNRPVVIRDGARDWEATRNWNATSLKSILGNRPVNVAVTPLGNADSPTPDEEGNLVFVKPLEEQQPFDEFLTFVTAQELTGEPSEEVRYAQTQNDNLRGEYETLFSHVKKDIPWARIALQQVPEAINLWIGNSRSVTALHKDNYENIYCQIVGKKHFVLLPPIAYAVVNERELPSACYVRGEDGRLSIWREEGVPFVPFATWDPDRRMVNATRYSELARPMRVTLEAGDMFYLPALWFHKVSQSCSEEGLCVAVNYWYDMDFSGSFYPLCNLARSTALAALGSSTHDEDKKY
ncbi:cupin-like domain-containing protein [Xylogone sp. PMI_703]|nr:cupin-like domain-containing protein [Xylogone sp. PMI_703]